MLSIIVAYDQQAGIGIQNALPWKLKQDLNNFKQITEHHYIVMGRKTYQSIGRPLPNRKNIVLSRQKGFVLDHCIILNEIQAVLNLAREKRQDEIFIIGGAQIYRAFLPYADRLYITEVDTVTKADAFFPKWDKSAFQRIGKRHYPKDENNQFDFTFTVWEKIQEK